MSAGLLLGVLLGSLLWTIGLIAVGLVAGHLYDDLHPPPPRSLEPEPESREELERALDFTARSRFAQHLCRVFVEVARIDGEVVADEVNRVHAFFEDELGYGPEELESVRAAIQEAIASPPDLAAALQACRREIPLAQHLLLLSALYELALADGALRRSEQEALRQIAEALSLSPEERRSIAAMHLGAGDTHYATLGVEPTASSEEIKRAYRRLAAVHHPDKVAHLGAGAVARAANQFRELKEAYEELRRLRGF